jgi:hypothetical protein
MHMCSALLTMHTFTVQIGSTRKFWLPVQQDTTELSFLNRRGEQPPSIGGEKE